MQKQLPGIDELATSTKRKRIKPFDPTRAGQTTARIAHICNLCGRGIAPGEIYYREGNGRFLGTLRGRKLCSRCYADLAGANTGGSPR